MKLLLLIAGFYAALNAAILAAIGLSVGFPAEGLISIVSGDPSMERMTREQMGLKVLLDSSLLAHSDRPQLILLGASGAGFAYPPGLMQPRLPDFTVTNLALLGAMVSEVLQVFDEVLWATPPEILRHSVLVLGISYTMTRPDSGVYPIAPSPGTAWWVPLHPVTNIDKATRRSPPILAIGHPMRAVLPQAVVLKAKQRLRIWARLGDFLPYHPGDWLAQRQTWQLQTASMHKNRTLRETAIPRKQPLVMKSIKEQTERLNSRIKKEGGVLEQGQFDKLSMLLDRATAAGMTVVVVHLPMHSEHRRYASDLPTFQKRLEETVAPWRHQHRVELLDLTDAVPDDNFRDYAHADSKHLETWVTLLVERLRPLLPDQLSRSRE